MNLKLTLPALGSLAAFLGTMLVLNQSDGQQPDEATARAALTVSDTNLPGSDTLHTNSAQVAPAKLAGRLNQTQAKTLLEGYTASYTKPWQDYAQSPHHYMSRVTPRPVPSLNTRIEWASSIETDNQLLATIRITKGLETTSAPCVIDRTTKQVRIFANDQWQSAEDWVKTAPQPNRFGIALPGESSETSR
jgi:hypothetical protein